MNQGYGSKGVVVPPRMGQGKGQGAVVAAVPTPTAGVQSGKGKGGGGSWGSNWGGCGVWQPMFNAMMMSMMGKGSGKNGLRSFAPDLKVWVGGMPPNNVSKEINMKLKEHMSSAGVNCLYAEVGKTGTGGAAFKTNSDAQVACAALNGSLFQGMPIQCDLWSAQGKKV
ncbi:unnamed protein product [Cladocopium goreaui]|uniref:Protein disulfide-isomerase n=2 Tax=Cladocopium goreaui TaxID=2562237 RepID=A0A9P1DKS4_9DINO|nr:unnamed protein product [Cladocopium goreaui]